MTTSPTPEGLGHASEPSQPTQTAVIHIGGTMVSMLVGEISPDKKNPVEMLEFLGQPIPVAEEIFDHGRLTQSTIERCVTIIERFQESLREYGLTSGCGVRAYVTNIIAEAENHERFLNRLQVACSLDVRPLDEGDMTRLIYMHAARLIRENADLKKAQLIVAHVGPGNSRLLRFEKGRIADYSSYRIGAHRVTEAIDELPDDARRAPEVIASHIHGMIEQIELDYGVKQKTDVFLSLGQELQSAAQYLGQCGPGNPLEQRKLQKFLKRLSGMSDGDIASLLEVDIHTAGAMIAGLECNLAIANCFKAKTWEVATGRFEESLLTDLASSEFFTKRFEKEVIQSALELGTKYKIDRDHELFVERLCIRFFQTLQPLHGLAPQDELLLRVAAILHEVGNFVSRRKHHKHSFYIIRNSEIFGLNDEETQIVALVARYHRGRLPDPKHFVFDTFSREQRIRISKLAAILRVADALDRTHRQRLSHLKPRLEDERLVLRVDKGTDVNVEELALRRKGDLFAQLFGLEIVIEMA